MSDSAARSICPSLERGVSALYDYVYWYVSIATKLAGCLPPKQCFYAFRSWKSMLPFEQDPQVEKMIMLSPELSIERIVLGRVLWIDLDPAPRDVAGVGEQFFLFDESSTEEIEFGMRLTWAQSYIRPMYFSFA
ncbi:hypothetical protein ACLOJK_041022 [Asimina triloba]